MSMLYEYIMMIEWQQVVMWAIGGLLIFLAIRFDMEPTLLLPMALAPYWSICLSQAQWIRAMRRGL